MLTHERLVEVLNYDPMTGLFSWRKRLAQIVKVGAIAGSINGSGYRQIRIDGRVYKAHRLAWFYIHGEWPAHDMDHAAGRRQDNRLEKIRPATRSQNRANIGKHRNNTTGFKGVLFVRPHRWRAVIKCEKRRYHLGYFDTPEEAHAAYAEKARELFGEFARAG